MVLLSSDGFHSTEHKIKVLIKSNKWSTMIWPLIILLTSSTIFPCIYSSPDTLAPCWCLNTPTNLHLKLCGSPKQVPDMVEGLTGPGLSTQSYSPLWFILLWKDVKLNQLREMSHGVNKYKLLIVLCRMRLILQATTCDNTYEILAIGGVPQGLSTHDFYWGPVMQVSSA